MLQHLQHGLSSTQLRELAEKGQRALARMANMRSAIEQQVGHVVRSIEVNVAAFGFGFARGYYAQPGKDLTVLGVPVDLAAGFAGHTLALMGFAGPWSNDVHALSDGSTASYFTTLGLKVGVDQRTKTPAAPPAAAAGYHGMSQSDVARAVATAAL